MSNTDPTRVMGAGGTTLMGGAPTAGVSDRTMVLGDGATQMMPAQQDAFRTQMGGTTVCPVCKSTTPLMEPYCGDCGFLLTSAPAEDVALPTEDAPAGELVDVASGQRYVLRPGANTVGRQGTDVLLNDGTVSRNHATITLANGAVTVEDLGSSNGTKVGDLRLGPNAPVPATPGTVLRFGNLRLTLEIGNGEEAAPGSAGSNEQTIAMSRPDRTLLGVPGSDTPAAAPQSAAPAMPASEVGPLPGAVALLRQIEGPGTDILVTGGTITMGRRPGNTLVLTNDAYLSGHHADLTTDNTGTYLTDMGSTNGTLLNGSKIPANEKQMLIEGDEVQIGQTKYRFELLDLNDDEGVTSEESGAANAALEGADPTSSQGANPADVYAEGAALEPLPADPDAPTLDSATLAAFHHSNTTTDAQDRGAPNE